MTEMGRDGVSNASLGLETLQTKWISDLFGPLDLALGGGPWLPRCDFVTQSPPSPLCHEVT